jgi:medium-chain acyl-[acyl-carrier-protein] hydrolase
MTEQHASPWRAVRRGTWLFSFEAQANAGARLFCFPHSGGGATAFRDWSASLRPAVDLVAVEPPGRGTRLREPCRSDLAGMAREIAAEIASLAGLPFAFFGHSVGTLIAFEVTRELRRLGRALPSMMIVSAGRAPNAPARPFLRPGISDDEIVRMVVDMGGVPQELEHADDLLQLWVPALRADLELLDGYVYTEEDPLPVPIVLFAGMLDEVVEFEAMEPWADLTSAGTSLAMFPGDHFYLAKESKQQVLASLARHLSSLRAKSAAT